MGKNKDQNRTLGLLIDRAREMGIEVRMERLEAGSIRPRDGMCILEGEKTLFLDKRRPIRELILYIKEYLKGSHMEP